MEQNLDGMELLRRCKKCLLRDLPEGEYFKNLREYIENLEPEIKVSDTVYEHRLALCSDCEHLLSGMCRICGCFVELRAVVRGNSCPGLEQRW